MLEGNLTRMYRKFRMQLYAKILRSMEISGPDALSGQEVIYLEIIHALGTPTVNEFARFAGLSRPNAAYRVAQLMQKGYVEKIRDEKDRREYHLKETEKYERNFNDISDYISMVCDRIRKRFSEKEQKELDRMLGILSGEIMTDRSTLRAVVRRKR